MSEIELVVPWLRAGPGVSPKYGGCVLQILSWVTTGEWTDDPPGVHPVIRHAAISANDCATDEDRQQLLDLGPRILNTATSSSKVKRVLQDTLVHLFEAHPNDALTVEDFGRLLDVFDKVTRRRSTPKPLDYAPLIAAGAPRSAWEVPVPGPEMLHVGEATSA